MTSGGLLLFKVGEYPFCSMGARKVPLCTAWPVGFFAGANTGGLRGISVYGGLPPSNVADILLLLRTRAMHFFLLSSFCLFVFVAVELFIDSSFVSKNSSTR